MATIRWLFVSVILFIELYFIIVLLFYRKSRIQYLIKDQSSIRDILKIPYSFARTQLVWWTFIIIACLSVSFGITGTLPGLTDPGLLVLLGLSAGTTTGGTIIDNHDIQKAARSRKSDNFVRHQDEGSEGFFTDILSDSNGISIHRFQAFVFNLLYGLIFILGFIDTSGTGFVHFDEFTLALLGISSAGYLTLKSQENV